MTNENPPPQKWSLGKRIGCFLMIVALIICAVLFTMACIAAYTALWAENGYHAILLVHEVTREYVSTHDGQWPRSWEDLENMPASEERLRQWSEDRERVRKYVHVDFNANPDELAEQTVVQFDAIKPIGPTFFYQESDPEVPNLLKLLKETRKAEVETSTESPPTVH